MGGIYDKGIGGDRNGIDRGDKERYTINTGR